MIDRMFLAHPRAVNESYFQHGRIAAHFGLTMVGGGLACLAHAIVPMFFVRSASDRVARLHAEMTGRRPRTDPAEVSPAARAASLDYVI